MRILAIDPGSERSAWVALHDGRPIEHAIEPNDQLLRKLRADIVGARVTSAVVIEWMTPRGMPIHRRPCSSNTSIPTAPPTKPELVVV